MIVRITPGNAAEASRIYALSWKKAYEGIVPEEYLASLSVDRWTHILAESSYTGFLLTDKGRYIGTSSVGAGRDEGMDGWGEIISLYILPDFWDQGYGRRLFQHAAKHLRQQGLDRIYLWVLEENIRARSFYELLSLVPDGKQKIIRIGEKDLKEIRYVTEGTQEPMKGKNQQ